MMKTNCDTRCDTREALFGVLGIHRGDSGYEEFLETFGAHVWAVLTPYGEFSFMAKFLKSDADEGGAVFHCGA